MKKKKICLFVLYQSALLNFLVELVSFWLAHSLRPGKQCVLWAFLVSVAFQCSYYPQPFNSLHLLSWQFWILTRIFHPVSQQRHSQVNRLLFTQFCISGPFDQALLEYSSWKLPATPGEVLPPTCGVQSLCMTLAGLGCGKLVTRNMAEEARFSEGLLLWCSSKQEC